MKPEQIARQLCGSGKAVTRSGDTWRWEKRGGYADAKLRKAHALVDS